MDDEQKKKTKDIVIIVLAVVGLGAAIASGVKYLAPEKENVIGSMDPPGGAPKGLRDAEVGAAHQPAEDGSVKPPVGIEGGRGD